MTYTPQKMETAINWMYERRKGGPAPVTYSMAYRYGPHSYDCSSAVDAAFTFAGLWPEDGPDNTDSLHADFEKMGWTRVPQNAQGGYDVKRGDVGIWGPRGASGGAFGHIVIMLDSENMIHCNFGYNGITINNHDLIWTANGKPVVYFYRPPAAPTGSTNVGTVEVPGSFTAAKNNGPYWRVEAGDTLYKVAMYYYGEASEATINRIAKYNDIVNANVINVGQRIYIPGPLRWTVEPGDTWEKIDAHYGYSRGAVQSRNPGVALTVGTVLKIWD